mmetsp:Transcript_618/g.2028  ORF Transcript_618/g.2028 Transcript_618/m.2028 type:complete len:127 (-) Transcript_618:58-438(-)
MRIHVGGDRARRRGSDHHLSTPRGGDCWSRLATVSAGSRPRIVQSGDDAARGDDAVVDPRRSGDGTAAAAIPRTAKRRHHSSIARDISAVPRPCSSERRPGRRRLVELSKGICFDAQSALLRLSPC